MHPSDFPDSNINLGPPAGLDESHVRSIRAFVGLIEGGHSDGDGVYVTAWKPSPEELTALNDGAPVFICFVGLVPPHFVATDFKTVTSVV